MTRTQRHRLGRAVAIAGIAALGTVGLFGVAAADAVSDFGNVDQAKTGSITIHKHEQLSAAAPLVSPDGTANVASPGVEGVEFTVFAVGGVDLGTAGGWDALQTLKPAADGSCDVPAPYTKTQVAKVVTDAAGAVQVGNLPVAAYLVCETNAPAKVTDKAAPFLVSVPLPFQDGWLYDVNVYPKNSVFETSKEIKTPPTFGLGTKVEFPVHVSVPTLPAGKKMSKFVVKDTLDPRLTPVAVESVQVGGTAVDPSFYAVSVVGQAATVTFNAAGLAWLDSQAGKKVDVVFSGVVAEIGSGIIENIATGEVNESGEVPTNTVVTKWGDLKVQKTDSASPANPLQGAEFEVYAAVTPYPAAPGDCSTAVPTGSAISVGSTTVFTSDAQGLVSVPGLFVSDTNTGEQGFRCYVVKETKAPAGYITPADPANLTGVAVTVGQTQGFDVTVKNQQTPPVKLPLTGSAGQTMLLVAGAGLLGAAVLLMVLRRRKRAETEV